MAEIVQILAGLGFVTAALAYAKYRVERRHWQQFKEGINEWIGRQVELKKKWAEEPHTESDGVVAEPSMLKDDVLTVVVEEMLSESGFAPLEVQQLLEIGLVITRGMAADKFLI